MRGIDAARVSEWLVVHIPGAVAPFSFELITGGRSNLTFAVIDGEGRRLVLRRPPLGHVLATAHDMAREHRLITAVGRTPVPVPTALGLCTDVDVNGAPFYVMSFVDGVVLDEPARAEGLTVAARHAAALDLIDVLAELHTVDVDAVGLGDLARHDGYVERQLKRWSAQWHSSKTRELAAIDEVERGLRAGVPPQRGTAIVHGDYRFGNCLVDPDDGTLTAVLDWELCTLGDALADVGYLGIYWTDPGQAPRQLIDPTPAGGFPPYADLVARYARRTGRDVSDIAFYQAFAAWRAAIICEGVYARYRQGAMGDADVDLPALSARVDDLAESALRSVQSLGPRRPK
jgi:aminoglycoside phosphotransferase (APT) family kinase protein